MSELLMSLISVVSVLCAVVAVVFIALQDKPYLVAAISLGIGVTVHAFYILAPIQSGACAISAYELVGYLHQLDVCMELSLERSLMRSSRNASVTLLAAQAMILAGVAAVPVIYMGNMAKRAEQRERGE